MHVIYGTEKYEFSPMGILTIESFALLISDRVADTLENCYIVIRCLVLFGVSR